MNKMILLAVVSFLTVQYAFAQDCSITDGNLSVFTEKLSITVNTDFDAQVGLTGNLPAGPYEICSHWLEPSHQLLQLL